MPDFDTRPIGPGPVIVAGMMPAFDLPGLITPGQFGPMIRVAPPFDFASAQNSAESFTGMPSVITTQSGIPASTASTTAAFAKAGGTKTTLVSAPVSAIASATVPKIGSVVPPISTVVPALRGFTPPTTCAPEASIRVACFVPSEPVSPWTMILVSVPIRIDMGPYVPSGRSQLGGLLGRCVHRVDDRDERMRRLREDAPPLLDVVAVEPHDERLVRLVAEASRARRRCRWRPRRRR